MAQKPASQIPCIPDSHGYPCQKCNQRRLKCILKKNSHVKALFLYLLNQPPPANNAFVPSPGVIINNPFHKRIIEKNGAYPWPCQYSYFSLWIPSLYPP